MPRFHLHSSVRRRLCRATFCLGCLLPTTSLLGWTIAHKLPGHVARRQARASELLGLEARIERVRYPEPGVCLCENIELTDPETRQRVLRCRWLELGQSGPVLSLRPANVEIVSPAAGRLVRLLMRRLQRELPIAQSMVRVLPSSVTLRGPRDEQSYDDVECLIESTDAGDSATIRFRLAGGEMDEAASVVISRRHARQAGTRVSLDTAGASLPVALFAPWADWQSVLGRDTRFRGSLWIDADERGWRGDITGVLSEVDLESLVGSRFPHLLTGRATLEIDRARLEQGRLVEATGLLRAEQGVIGRSLVVSMSESLACRPIADRADQPRSGNCNYGQLFVRFVLDSDGLRLTGSPSQPNAGFLLTDEHGKPLLAEPVRQPAPLVAFVRALVPLSRMQVPATEETASLIPWLPLPPVVPPPAPVGSPARPRARVRLEK